MDAVLAIDAATGIVIAAAAYFGLGFKDIGPTERGVVLRLGRCQRVVGPGRTLVLLGLDRLVRVDMRPFKLAIEIPVLTSREGTWHAASLVAECHVLQPERAVDAQPHHIEATRAVLEAVTREAASEMAAAELVAERARLGRGLKKIANERALTWGVDVQSVEVSRLEALPAPGPGEEARWEVVLTRPGEHKIEVLKLVREATHLGLKEAKDLVEAAPAALVTGLTLQAAEALRARLVAAGAAVDLVPRVQAAREPGVATGSYRIVLQSPGEHTIDVLKLVREATGLGLAEAKALVDRAPATIKERLDYEDAERLRKAFEEHGARVTVE